MVITDITVHASADEHGSSKDVHSLRDYHVRVKRWSDIGYHFVITAQGIVQQGRPLDIMGAHVYGHNHNNIGICLIGGLKDGKPSNDYSVKQYAALFKLLVKLCIQYRLPYTAVKGHRDWFPDRNGDGVIDKQDWLKDCPCFDVRNWFKASLEVEGFL